MNKFAGIAAMRREKTVEAELREVRAKMERLTDAVIELREAEKALNTANHSQEACDRIENARIDLYQMLAR